MASRKELVGALGALLRRIEHADHIDQLRQGTVVANAMAVFVSALKGNPAPLPWTPLEPAANSSPSEREIQALAKSTGQTVEMIRAEFDRMEVEERVWVNATYNVSVRDLGDDGRHLSIKRIDQEPIHDWRDLQRIKNEVLGPECEAVELYPAESRRVDCANQFHLFGTADPTFRFGFGFNERRVDDNEGSHLQRAL